MIAALSVSPRRRRVGLYFSLRANTNVRSGWVEVFLRQLRRHLRGPICLVWDRLPSHRARSVRAFLETRARFHAAFLPAYAPELNPVEAFWSYLKTNPLANLSAENAQVLVSLARRQARLLRSRQELLKSLIRWSPLHVLG